MKSPEPLGFLLFPGKIRHRLRRRFLVFNSNLGDVCRIKTVVNKVVFPAIYLILAVFFFAKLGMAHLDYRKHGQFESADLWTRGPFYFQIQVDCKNC